MVVKDVIHCGSIVALGTPWSLIILGNQWVTPWL